MAMSSSVILQIDWNVFELQENVFSVAAGDAQTKILRQIELESNPAEHLPETSKGSNSNGFTQVINLVAEQ